MKTALLHYLKLLSAVGIAWLAGYAMPAGAQETAFPVAPEEVIDLPDGRTVEVYKGTVQHASGNRLTVRFPAVSTIPTPCRPTIASISRDARFARAISIAATN